MNREDIKIDDFKNLNNSDKILFLLKFASIAPSSHNTQPWKFKIKNNSIEILPEYSRALKSDPDHRELFLSLGTCCENLLLASEAYGLNYRIEEANGTFKITYNDLGSKKQDNATLNAMINRSCNRSPFETTKISDQFIETMKSVAKEVEINFIADNKLKEQVVGVVGDSIQQAFQDKEFTKELSQWIKPSLEKYQIGMTGYSVGIPWITSFIVPWMIGHLKMDVKQRKMDEVPLKASPMFVLLSHQEDNPPGWLKVGQAFEAIAVEATKLNLKISLQGAPIEIGNHYLKIKELFGAKGRPMIFFRIGYTSSNLRKSPRLLVKQLIDKNE